MSRPGEDEIVVTPLARCPRDAGLNACGGLASVYRAAISARIIVAMSFPSRTL